MRFAAIIAAAFLAVDPFGWDQYGPLRFALVSTLGFAAIAVSLGSGDLRSQPLPRWSVLGWIGVLLAMSISTATSADSWHALIGTPERHLGLASWVLFAGLFAVSSLYPFSAVEVVSRAAVLVAVASGVWAILESLDIGWFDSAFAGDRVGGPLGQPAYLGAGMLLVVPLAAAAAVDRFNSITARLLGASGTALGLCALALSESRAAWVGALAAAALLVIRRKQIIGGLVGAAAIAALLIFTPLGDRAATLTDVDSGVVAGRLDEWQVGARAVLDTPTFGITGHGPEGYRTVFGEHVDEAYVVTYGRDVITDRAHNGILDTALTGGLSAAAAMLLLQIGLVITALQRIRANTPLDVALGAASIAYVIQQLFLFPLAELDPVLWIVAGLLIARRPHRLSTRAPLFRQVSGGRRAAMFGAGFLSAVAAIAGLSDVAADHAVLDVVEADDGATALRAADRARDRRPDSIRYDFIAARAASAGGTADDFRTSLDRLQHGLALSPKDPAFLTEQANVLLEIARRSTDERDLDVAMDALEERDALDPNNPSTQQSFGTALALDGQTNAAIAQLEHAAALDPTSIESLLNLALVQLEDGRLDDGATTLERVDDLAPTNANAQQLRRDFLSG
ncbi:MAG: O-antigen ligase/Flp pilus assembly protein TadD [Verrucomicrobiales bacterium]|jgi:O-antigen ligase/Flp pilus assembly protein TadD